MTRAHVVPCFTPPSSFNTRAQWLTCCSRSWCVHCVNLAQALLVTPHLPPITPSHTPYNHGGSHLGFQRLRFRLCRVGSFCHLQGAGDYSNKCSSQLPLSSPNVMRASGDRSFSTHRTQSRFLRLLPHVKTPCWPMPQLGAFTRSRGLRSSVFQRGGGGYFFGKTRGGGGRQPKKPRQAPKSPKSHLRP